LAPRTDTGSAQKDLFTTAPLPVAPLDDDQRLACLRLIRSENVGPATFRALINQYGGATAALEALPDIARRGGRTIRICPASEAEAELLAARRIGAHPLFTIEPGYPAAMAFLEHAPPMIYAAGDPALLNKPSLAVVGSRRASAAGIKLTRQLAAEVGREGIVIVSGLARGIDAAAHEATLRTGTIAVLAGGLDIVYPPEHADLQRRIAEQGCLISERPPGLEPRARDFPRRNRLISGISYAVLVVEAARRSGTLITTRFALEQGRDVMAVPGHPLDPRAEGTNDLLKRGATLVTEASDIIEAFAPLRATPPHMQQVRQDERDRATTEPPAVLRDGGVAWPALSEAADAPATIGTSPPMPNSASNSETAQDLVIAALGPAPVNIDEIARSTALPVQTVQVALLELSLAGRIEHHGSQLVSLRDPPSDRDLPGP
jgi:DNA processing protein